MHYFYWDASALAKRYAPEIGTPLVNALFLKVPRMRMLCLSVGTGEVISVLVRKKNAGLIPEAAFAQALIDFRAEVISSTDFRLVAVDDSLIFIGAAMLIGAQVAQSGGDCVVSLAYVAIVNGFVMSIWTKTSKKLVGIPVPELSKIASENASGVIGSTLGVRANKKLNGSLLLGVNCWINSLKKPLLSLRVTVEKRSPVMPLHAAPLPEVQLYVGVPTVAPPVPKLKLLKVAVLVTVPSPSLN